MAAKDEVIHISTGIYYLLPRYLPLGVIVPYGTRACARGRKKTWDHGPAPPVARRKARGATSITCDHSTVSTITRPPLDFPHGKQETNTNNPMGPDLQGEPQ